VQSAVATALSLSNDDVTVNYNDSDKSADVCIGDRELTDDEKTAIAGALATAMPSYKVR